MKIILNTLEIIGLVFAVLDFLNLTKKLEQFIDRKRKQLEEKFLLVNKTLSSQVENYMKGAKKKFNKLFLGLSLVMVSAFFFGFIIDTVLIVIGIFHEKTINWFQIFYNFEGLVDSLGKYTNYLLDPANLNAFWILIWLLVILYVILTLLIVSLIIYMYIRSRKLFADLFFLLSLIINNIFRTVASFLHLIDKAPSGTVGTIGLLIAVSSFLLSRFFY